MCNIHLQEMWFQQLGATPHFSTETIQLFKEKFNGRFSLSNDDVNWPPSLCDLTPLDYFLFS